MSPFAIAAIALVLGLVLGSIAVIGAPIFALPVVLLLLLGLANLELSRRRSRMAAGRNMSKRRREAGIESVVPAAESPETLTESAPRSSGEG